MDELRNTKKEVARLLEEYPQSKYRNWRFLVFQPQRLIQVVQQIGIQGKAEYDGKGTYIYNGNKNNVKWLSKDIFAAPFTNDYRTDYEIWQRVTDETPLINYISSRLALVKNVGR
jgi:hypothetical protein